MASSRLPANLHPNALSLAVDAKRKRGVTLVDLTESNPTRAGFDYPADLLAPLADPGSLVYAPSPLGLASARAAVAREYARQGLASGNPWQEMMALNALCAIERTGTAKSAPVTPKKCSPTSSEKITSTG